jgi:hypothetical protein
LHDRNSYRLTYPGGVTLQKNQVKLNLNP